jgi:hypothetical protein
LLEQAKVQLVRGSQVEGAHSHFLQLVAGSTANPLTVQSISQLGKEEQGLQAHFLQPFSITKPFGQDVIVQLFKESQAVQESQTGQPV